MQSWLIWSMHWKEKSWSEWGVLLKWTATSQDFLFVIIDDLWFLNLTLNSVVVEPMYWSLHFLHFLYIYIYIYIYIYMWFAMLIKHVWQLQRYPLTLSTHVPLFKQGLLTHSLISKEKYLKNKHSWGKDCNHITTKRALTQGRRTWAWPL